MMGVALVNLGKPESYPTWYQALPKNIESYSGYWFAVGDWALSEGNAVGAVRALAEATRRDPNEPAYWALLAVALRKWHVENPDSDAIDYPLVANAIVQRQTDLLTLRDQFSAFKGDGQKSQSLALEVAKTLSKLGRRWESEAWLAIATTLRDDPSVELAPFRQEVLQSLAADRDWQSTRDHPEVALRSFEIRTAERPAEASRHGGSDTGSPAHDGCETDSNAGGVELAWAFVLRSHR